MLTMIMDGRKKREIDPTLQMLREANADAKNDHDSPASRRSNALMTCSSSSRSFPRVGTTRSAACRAHTW